MASGDTLIVFGAYDNVPPSSNYATLDMRNLHPVLDFDSGTDESAVFPGVMPQNYAGTTGVTVRIWWSADGVTTGNAVLDAAWERIVADSLDIDADSFAAVNSVTDAAPGTDGHVTIATITFTDGADMDAVQAGDAFRLKITRDANNGSDTLAADIEIHRVEVQET